MNTHHFIVVVQNCFYSVKPLWHIMIGTAVVMQTATYIFKEGMCDECMQYKCRLMKLARLTTCFSFLYISSASHISYERAIKKAAFEEYKTNHPDKFHH